MGLALTFVPVFGDGISSSIGDWLTSRVGDMIGTHPGYIGLSNDIPVTFYNVPLSEISPFVTIFMFAIFGLLGAIVGNTLNKKERQR